MKKLFDLRFVIGVFFLVLGVLLLSYSLITGNAASQIINITCGIVYVLFAIIMLLIPKSKDSETVSESFKK